jgi:hypothetical protein
MALVAENNGSAGESLFILQAFAKGYQAQCDHEANLIAKR